MGTGKGSDKMSYAVIHMQKIKMGGTRGIQNHNERLKESHTNPDIDYSKTHLNKDLHQKDLEKTYYNRIRDRIKELDLPKAVRKDAVTMCGFICTSDREYFDKLTQSEQDRFFKESYEFLKNRYGEKNIVASTVHYDEKTPHLHYYIVPVTSDRRLSAKNIFTRTELKRLQTEYPQHMQSKGFELERGITSERKHLDTQEFKLQTKKQDIERTNEKLEELQEHLNTEENKIRELELQRDTIKSDLNALENDFDKVKVLKVDFDKVNALKGKYGLLNKNKITIDKKDFEELKDIAKKQHVLERKIQVLKQDNDYMKQDLSKYKSMDARINQAKKEKKMMDMSNELNIIKKYLVETDQIERVRDFARSLNKNQSYEHGRS